MQTLSVANLITLRKKKLLFEVKIYWTWLLQGSGSGAAFALVIRELCNDGDSDSNENGKKAG